MSNALISTKKSAMKVRLQPSAACYSASLRNRRPSCLH